MARFDPQRLLALLKDESLEQLGELEHGLLRLETHPDDASTLQAVFRNAHTIKGSAGSLGLTHISTLTHAMEELLDMMRQGDLLPEKGSITELLKCKDLLFEMVSGLGAEGPAFDEGRFAEYLSSIKALKSSGRIKLNTFEILLRPSPEVFLRGADPADFIRRMPQSVQVLQVQADDSQVPALSELDPTRCYTSWRIIVSTSLSAQDLLSHFEFLAVDGEVKINDSTSNNQPALAPCAGLSTPGSAQPLKAQSATIRVGLDKLDSLLNSVGEMLIAQSMIQQAIHKGGDEAVRSLRALSPHMQAACREVQERAMALRMLPVKEVFDRFDRLTRELSLAKGKQARLVLEGEDTELDKGMLDKISDPLVHLVRNAIDHGIESPEIRQAAGKPPEGTLILKAYQLGDAVYIEVSDDGAGIDTNKLIKKATSLGLIEQGQALSEGEAMELIFHPGFSTAEQVTDVSGRGVGMDVVKKNVEGLGGRVSVRSTLGKGTSITLKLPLTLAIIDGLLAQVGDQAFVIPVVSVVESLRPRKEDVHGMQEQGQVVDARGEVLPLVRLHNELNIIPKTKNPWEAIVVIVQSGQERCCLLVDDIIGQQQVVLKPLGSATPSINDISGGTILGDGQVALVLDIQGLVERARARQIHGAPQGADMGGQQ